MTLRGVHANPRSASTKVPVIFNVIAAIIIKDRYYTDIQLLLQRNIPLI